MPKETTIDQNFVQESLDLSKKDIALTLTNALLNLPKENLVTPKEYLSGLKENIEGALGWVENQKTKTARAIVATSLLFQIATSACTPRQTLIQENSPIPQPPVASETINSEQISIPTVEPTPTIEPYIEKLTDDFEGQTEELYGETKLEMQNGEWSLVDVEGRQAAGFIEGEWWINYAWVGPKSIPSWDREDYLCDDEIDRCGVINMKRINDLVVVDYPFPDDFEKNPFVKREMESIEKWLTEEMRVPLGNIPIGEGFPQYKGTIDIILSKVVLGQGKDFRWTILPLYKTKTFPQWPAPVWLVKVDEKGVIRRESSQVFYKINDSGENVVFENKTLRITFAGTPYFDENFQKTDSDQYFWREMDGIIASHTTDEWLNNQKWTPVPYADRGDILLSLTSGGDMYNMFWPNKGTTMWFKPLPLIK